MIYFKYRKFIRIFKNIQKMNNLEHLDWLLEERFGTVGKEALSILEAKGALRRQGIYSYWNRDDSVIDALILEYTEKCSGKFWEFMKWTIGTGIAIAGLYIAYQSFVKVG